MVLRDYLDMSVNRLSARLVITGKFLRDKHNGLRLAIYSEYNVSPYDINSKLGRDDRERLTRKLEAALYEHTKNAFAGEHKLPKHNVTVNAIKLLHRQFYISEITAADWLYTLTDNLYGYESDKDWMRITKYPNWYAFYLTHVEGNFGDIRARLDEAGYSIDVLRNVEVADGTNFNPPQDILIVRQTQYDTIEMVIQTMKGGVDD